MAERKAVIRESVSSAKLNKRKGFFSLFSAFIERQAGKAVQAEEKPAFVPSGI